MVNIIKYKHKLCKKYEEDLWGFVVGKGKFNRVGEYLSSLDAASIRLNRTDMYDKMLKDRKKVCLFYGGLKVYEYRRYCAEAKLRQTGSLNKNYNDRVVSLLERRLDVFVYRLNFVASVAEGSALIKAGCILVNKKEVLTPYTLLKKGDLVEVRKEYRSRMQEQMLQRFKLNFYPILYPTYVEVNYQIMSGFLLDYPVLGEVYYPFELDENFYYLSYFSRFN